MAIRSRNAWIRPPGPVADGLRIGLFGGSFNPAHDGHVHASTLAMKQLGLDYVWWLVSPQNPLKEAEDMASLPVRLQQAKAFVSHPRIVVTGIEDELGTRFTIDTIGALKRRFPRLNFVWLMGSDNLVQLPRWRGWQAILASVPVAVVARPGTAMSARTSLAAARFHGALVPASRHFSVRTPPAWTILDGKRSLMSATALRGAGSRS